MPRDESLTATRARRHQTATTLPHALEDVALLKRARELDLLHRSRRRAPPQVSFSGSYEHVRPDAEDRLPVVKLGKYLRFDRRDLAAYIDAKRAESRSQPRRR